MRISELKIENFRAFKNETIKLGDYVSIVGPNGAGKSTVLTALRVFFRDKVETVTDLQALSEDDFNNKDTATDIVITVTFENLSADAKESLKHYYRHDKLIVSAVAHWDPLSKRAEVLQYGERMGILDFVPFFRAEKKGEPLAELKAIYEDLHSTYHDLLTSKTKQGMIDALHAYEAAHPERLSPIRGSDQFYGFTKGESLLRKFVQWVFVPAVKDASSENLESKKNALRALLERTVRARINFDEALTQIRTSAEENYRKVLAEQQNILQELSKSLTARVATWAHPDASIKLQWDEEASNYVRIDQPLARVFGKEREFETDMSRFGHGFQRSYLLALLQELSGCLDTGEPTLILGCEEPELHQHPPQARHMATVLELLSKKNAQVIVSSHSPNFVRGMTFEDVRLTRYNRQSGSATVRGVSLEDISQLIGESLGDEPVAPTVLAMKIEQTLQERLKEMFFSPVLVMVEGLEDIGYLESYIGLLDLKDPLRAHGCHIVPTSGKDCMIRPLAIAKLLEIPTFVVFDADADAEDNKEQNERYNTAIMRLCGIEVPDPFPTETLKSPNLWAWPTNIGDIVLSEIGDDEWNKIAFDLSKRKGCAASYLKKDQIFIGHVLCLAWEKGRRSHTLESACKAIMSFAIRERAAVLHQGEPK